jgi:uncharacterized integral membrane protein
MIYQILVHTPIWVWVVLALLVARGWMSTRARDGSLGALFILPVIMLAIGLQGMVSRFGVEAMPWGAWLAAFIVFGFGGWLTVRQNAVAATEKGLRLAGSYWPLVIILAIFILRYFSEVIRALNPEMMQEPLAVGLVSALYGTVTGMFLGRLARIVSLYRASRRTVPRGLAA